jgi:hypothetical protein
MCCTRYYVQAIGQVRTVGRGGKGKEGTRGKVVVAAETRRGRTRWMGVRGRRHEQRETADRKWHHPQPPLTIVVLELYEGPDQARFESRTKAVDDTRDRLLWFVQVVIIWTRVGAVTYFCIFSVAPSRRNKQVICFFFDIGDKPDQTHQGVYVVKRCHGVVRLVGHSLFQASSNCGNTYRVVPP